MAWHSIIIIPTRSDRFSVKATFSDGLPAIYVTEDIHIQFAREDVEFAIEYLTDLADKARALALQVAEATS
jgi:hypothetical protein